MISPRTNRNVVILDRDGTIVVDRHYLNDPAGLEFLPGAAEGLRALYEHEYRLVVITNQSGVSRGLISLDQVERIHQRLIEMVRLAGARLDAIFFCPHMPDAACACRKPQPGLLLRAASELHFDPSSTIIVGDKESDIELGFKVGAPAVLISNRRTGPASPIPPDFMAENLEQAAEHILGRSGRRL